jgi:hypothetical protein
MILVMRRQAVSLLASAGLAITALACFAIPMYVIRPFRAQGARELSIALRVVRIAPAITAVCAVLAIAVLWFVWLNFRKRLPRITAVILTVLTVGCAVLTRINIYELLFHPIDSPRFESADKVKVDSDDMVMAVEVNGARRAYPVLEIAYHHVVNDMLGGEPIAATY